MVDRKPAITAANELRLLNLLFKQATLEHESFETRLFNLMRMINIKVGAVRSSLIQCVSDQHGVVLASNDDQNVTGLRLSFRTTLKF